MPTSNATKGLLRLVNPRAWPRLLLGHRRATTRTYTLLLGDRTVTTEQVDARVVASAGYRAGLPKDAELRHASHLADTPMNRDSTEKPTIYIADRPAEASAWRLVDDLTVEAYDDTAPALRFTSRSGQALSSELRQAVERADLVLVVTASHTSHLQSTSPVDTWNTVVLFPAA